MTIRGLANAVLILRREGENRDKQKVWEAHRFVSIGSVEEAIIFQ